MELTLKQQQFCKHYIEAKGNATRAYMKAFCIRNTETAKVNGSRLLTNANISGKIKELMEENGFNDVYVDLELMKIIQQDKNMHAKIRGIEIYNKLKIRYVDIGPEPDSDIDFSSLSNEELDRIIHSGRKGR